MRNNILLTLLSDMGALHHSNALNDSKQNLFSVECGKYTCLYLSYLEDPENSKGLI